MIEFLKLAADWFLHLDAHLGELVSNYGTLVYLILFLVIFTETGLVVMPFLPGDSLLFAAGMLASLGDLNPWLLIILLIIAAILGDTVNYHIGKYIGPKVFTDAVPTNFFMRLLKKEHLEKAQAFYEKHGGKTIIMARFVPIVRTFAPFVAGVSKMNYSRFITYNIVGGVIWVTGLTLAGYYLAEFEFVRKNFEKVIFAIILISVLPIVVEFFRNKKAA
ncbi:DedA family protein [Cytophaga hutchinsonii]|uniref:Integral membrane protein possible DedA family protein n=1 Tax=Cytophaga hutchinsonii (strain ATCC 33406 / DSM 1761 / CIP 103989 / NBRC 15051 / NCIMB 9469 / D465) TaxID=269798 RepID=A0A6N4SM30_CYTH3|nr:integral membrane protein; possible DedA family protein [Cytophaga hutchinsonii ATCC 33406]SFX45869.1 membrane-associated protein [Cytophaga hutchinsonii ATCC 33406]